MNNSIRVLVVEDRAVDAEIAIRELRRAGFAPEWSRVETEQAFLEQLQAGVDLVISDFDLPHFSGLRALQLRNQSGIEVPFILVSGTIGEDTAVAAMKEGAADYFLKDRMARLGPSATRAIAESRARRELRKKDEEFRLVHAQLQQLLQHSPAVLYAWKIGVDKFVPFVVSENVQRLLGVPYAESLNYDWWLTALHPEDRDRAVAGLTETIARETTSMEYRMRSKDGTYRWIEDNRQLVRHPTGEPAEIVGVWTDVSERIHTREALAAGARKIRDQLDELLRWQEVMLGREDRVQALKVEVNTLLTAQGLPPRYVEPSAS